MPKTIFSKCRATFSALRHVPITSILARLRREFRWRRLLKNPEIINVRLLSDNESARAVHKLTTPNFATAAHRLAELTASSFSFDRKTNTLIFIKSGDRISVDDIENVAWNSNVGVPTADVNRCYFMSFIEIAPLLHSSPAADLDFIFGYVSRLNAAARLGGDFLAIPWQPLAAARRLINLLAALALLLEQDGTLGETDKIRYLLKQVRHLLRLVVYLREDDLGYNHLATEVFAQCLYTYVFEDNQALDSVSSEFLDIIEGQIGVDGFQLERSATYQAHLLGHLDVLLRGNIFPVHKHAALAEIAGRMRNALAVLTHPDGEIAVFNDAAIGDGPSPAALEAWPRVMPDRATVLPEAGIARLQGGPFVALFDVGPCGPDDNPGHAHADFLSFELSVAGKRFIVDPGVASYKAGTERDWTRSSLNHNGPAFLGLEPIEFIGPFRVGRRGRAHLLSPSLFSDVGASIIAAGWLDGFDRFGGRVGRCLGLSSHRTLSVTDVWLGRPDLTAHSTFLVPTSWEICTAGPTHIEFVSNNTGTHLILKTQSGTLTSSTESIHYPYGPRKPTQAHRITLIPTFVGESTRTVTFTITTHTGRFDESTSDLWSSRIASALTNALKRH